MCGIVGYIGKKAAYPILMDGLQKLAYRGYDSTGIALLNGSLNIYKKKGKIADLYSFTKGKKIGGSIGIGHTRWATHEGGNDINAQPHTSASGRYIIVQNGFIENFEQLKTKLQKIGYTFHSRTDTEVLINWIEHIQLITGHKTLEAVRIALNMVKGSYALAIIDEKNADQLIIARKRNTLIIGTNEDGFYIASDSLPIEEYTKDIFYLDSGQLTVLNLDGSMSVQMMNGESISPTLKKNQVKTKMLT